MDDDDPEKRIAELERGLAEHYPASEAPPAREATADPSWAAPPAREATPDASWAATPAPPAPIPQYIPPAGPIPALYGRRRSPVFRVVWIIGIFWAVAIPIGIAFSWFMSSRLSGMDPFGPSTLTVTKGGSVSVGGNNETKTIECNDGSVSLSGNNGNFTVTGHCATVNVSGNNTHATIDWTDVIVAGGINTVTIYHKGEPKVTKGGINVSVSQG
jgi:hypothetical protein